MTAPSRVLTASRTLTAVKGKALYFDGIDDMVDCGNDESLNPTEEITLCAWVLLKEKKIQGIIAKDGYWHLECYHDGKFAFEGQFGGDWQILTAPSSPDLNKWYFVCGVFKANYVGLYVNGEEVSSDDWGEGIGTLSERGVYIGKTVWAWYAENNKYFNGTIALVRIYERALSAAEVLYNKEHPYNPILHGCVLWLGHDSIDEGAGMWYDKTSYGNDGVIYGATAVEMNKLAGRVLSV